METLDGGRRDCGTEVGDGGVWLEMDGCGEKTDEATELQTICQRGQPLLGSLQWLHTQFGGSCVPGVSQGMLSGPVSHTAMLDSAEVDGKDFCERVIWDNSRP